MKLCPFGGSPSFCDVALCSSIFCSTYGETFSSLSGGQFYRTSYFPVIRHLLAIERVDRRGKSSLSCLTSANQLHSVLAEYVICGCSL